MLKMICCIAADILALIYLIWPFDIVPDIMPVVGFMDSLFSAAKIARLKNTSSLLTANSLINVCAFRASMQQFPKLIFCSTVAF